MNELLRFVLAAVFMILGVAAILLSVLGVSKFHFVMNRMHCAAITDTMGALCVILSLMIATGGLSNIVKLAIILGLVWIGSPISSHLVGRMELSTDETIGDHVKLKKSEVEHNDGVH